MYIRIVNIYIYKLTCLFCNGLIYLMPIHGCFNMSWYVLLTGNQITCVAYSIFNWYGGDHTSFSSFPCIYIRVLKLQVWVIIEGWQDRVLFFLCCYFYVFFLYFIFESDQLASATELSRLSKPGTNVRMLLYCLQVLLHTVECYAHHTRWNERCGKRFVLLSL